MNERWWTVSAADCAFLWPECQRCFYLKVVSGLPRPSPAADASLAVALRDALDGRRTEALHATLGPGIVHRTDRRIESSPVIVYLPEKAAACAVRAEIDTLLSFEDGTHGLVALLAAPPSPQAAARHARKLHAEAHALEHAGGADVKAVSRLGLLVLEPVPLAADAGRLSVSATLSWTDVPRDEQAFFGFLAEVLTVLERPAPPGGVPLCEWCQYRDISRRTGL